MLAPALLGLLNPDNSVKFNSRVHEVPDSSLIITNVHVQLTYLVSLKGQE